MQAESIHPKLIMDTIVRGVSTLQERAFQLVGVDLTAQQAAVAIGLLELGGQTLNQLTARLQIAQPAVTRLVDRLEHKHLVERSPSADDGRVVIVALTRTGETVAQTALRVINDLKRALLADIDPNDLMAFWRVLNQMHAEVVDQLSAEPAQ